MDLAARLQQMEEMVREAKSMPLSSSALLNRDEVLELLQEMQESLPEEIKQARWVVKDREELLAKARHDAEAIVEAAREEQLRLATHEQVVERAAEEAERILREADDEGRRMKDEAEDYVDAKLAQFEIVLRRLQEEAHTSTRALARTLDQVELGREKLRGAPTTVAEDELGGEAGAEAPRRPELFDDGGDQP
jgi:cell division septum initiation protein DivIVA